MIQYGPSTDEAPPKDAPPKVDGGKGGRVDLPFRLLGGILILASPLLPFMNPNGFSLYERISLIVPEIVPMYTYFVLNLEVVTSQVVAAYSLLIIGALLFLMAGLVCFASGKRGGIIGLLGVTVEVIAFSLFGGFSPQMLIFAGPGFYAALSGSLTAIISKWLAK